MSKPQAIKLQKYSITPFKGDYKEWLRFWNQFVVDVGNSKISNISNLIIYLSWLKRNRGVTFLAYRTLLGAMKKQKGS